jgi:DNA-binding transcriptional MerR regulator
LDVFGAAQRTGLSVRTLRYFRDNDQGPPSYRLGLRVLYDVADLDSWVADRKAHTLRGDRGVSAQ